MNNPPLTSAPARTEGETIALAQHLARTPGALATFLASTRDRRPVRETPYQTQTVAEKHI